MRHHDGFNKMVQDALDGKIDLIVTKSVSRFARNTVDSLTTVRNLKEKGVEAYFQKKNIYTLDFLSKKKKVNEGEAPQYYVEHNHDAIIEPVVFEAMQKQMAVRQTETNRQSSMGIFSSKIKCGDCGS